MRDISYRLWISFQLPMATVNDTTILLVSAFNFEIVRASM